MMSDRELKREIVEELDFEPGLRDTDLAIVVESGVVTLIGHLPTLAARMTVRDIVETIPGVRAIADMIEVRPVGAHVTDDDEIARRVVKSLRWNTQVPEDRIRATVAGGWVTLRGGVEWRYQSRAAEQVVRGLIGVTGVENLLEVVPAAAPVDIACRIQRALRRNAETNACAIWISVDGGTVTLEGCIRHLAEGRIAERAAWAAPGVSAVIVNLCVT